MPLPPGGKKPVGAKVSHGFEDQLLQDEKCRPEAQCVTREGFQAGVTAALHAMPQAAVMADRNGGVLALNQHVAHIPGLPSAETGRTIYRPVVEEAAQAGRTIQTRLDLSNGRPLEVTVTPLVAEHEMGQGLYLVTCATGAPCDQDVQGRASDRGRPVSLQTYDMGPTPTRSLREEAARFKRLSETDPLTGALNVRAFAARVTQALVDRPNRRAALIFLDLNGFKAINDRFGHAAGDLVLAHVARKLTFPPQTWIATARVGGDEFAIWMPGVEPTDLAGVIAGIHARLGVPVEIPLGGGKICKVMVTASIGAACCPFEARTYDALRHLADTRMYGEKANASEHRK